LGDLTMSRLHQLAINDEGFIFDPATGESFTVNSTGLFIIQELKENKSNEEIVAALNNEFEDAPESTERDMIDFIAHLKIHRLM
jgi:hypothetical protein